MAQVQVCRTCLSVIEKNTNFVSLDATDPSPNISEIKSKLEACVPEMTLSVAKNPAMCGACLAALDAAYNFKKQCLNTEEKIYEYMLDCDTESVDLQFLAKDNKENITIFKSETDEMSIEEPLFCNDAVESHSSSNEVQDNFHKESNGNNNCVEVDSDFESSEKASQSLLPPCFVVVTPLSKEALMGVECAESKDIDNLEIPQKQKNKKTVFGHYKCFICNLTYRSKGKMMDHFRYHYKMTPNIRFTCYPYSATQAEPIRMVLEWKTHANEKRMKCGLCSVSGSAIVAHMRTHTGERPYSCNFCNYRATRKDVATKHMETVHKKIVKKLQWTAPQQKATQQRKSATQQKAATPQKAAATQKAAARQKAAVDIISDGETQNSQTIAIGNYDTQKSKENGSPIVVRKLDNNLMDLTGKRAKSRSKNKNRQKRRRRKNMFTKNKDVQKISIENHVSKIYFKCVYCQFSTEKSTYLKIHMSNHWATTTYKCAFCEFVASRVTDLKYHTNLHSDKTVYQCANCEYNTIVRAHFEDHIVVHSTVKRYKCKVCAFAARHRLGLYSHKKKYHK